MPTWAWYAIGLGGFILLYLYLKSAGSVGKVAQTLSPNALANYSGNVDLLTAMLDQQGHDIADLKKMRR